MDKFYLSVCIIVGVIMRWQRSRYVYLRKHMNMLRTYYRVCASSPVTSANSSGDLEITVQFLIQVDKLVQILESPVFTCNPLVTLANDRFEIAASRTGEIPIPFQMSIRTTHAPSSILRIRNPPQSSKQYKPNRLPPPLPSTVFIPTIFPTNPI